MPEFTLLQSLALEVAVGLLAIVLCRWELLQRFAALVEDALSRLSQRPWQSFLFITFTSVAVRLSMLPLRSVPIPLFHDEFSYLLGADTFVHGRLTNPQPPFPGAFETIHINLWPTYQSMYMPGTALLLAIGKVFGCPWLSVLVTTGVFCGAMYWMVSAWLPRPYALAASFIALAMTSNLSWWFDNYFCISLSALGATLVLGCLPRIWKAQSLPMATLLGVGLSILMLTRPYEGFCIAFPCVVVLVWKMRRIGLARLSRLSAPPVALLLVTFAWLLYYNWRGTGHPLLFPYMLDYRTYHITGPFLWSAERPLPSYRLDILRRFYIYVEVGQFEFVHSHPWLFFERKLWIYYFTYVFGFGLSLVAGVVLLFRLRNVDLWFAPLLAFAGFCFNVAMMAWAPFPQYAAPAAPLLLLIVTITLRALRNSWWPALDGKRVSRGFLFAELLLGLSLLGLRIANSNDFQEPRYVSQDRASIERSLSGRTKKQLCLVRYSPDHEPWQEWVFDGADPQNQKIIWARSLNSSSDRGLIHAFSDREVWLVQPDQPNDLISPYRAGALQ